MGIFDSLGSSLAGLLTNIAPANGTQMANIGTDFNPNVGGLDFSNFGGTDNTFNFAQPYDATQMAGSDTMGDIGLSYYNNELDGKFGNNIFFKNGDLEIGKNNLSNFATTNDSIVQPATPTTTANKVAPKKNEIAQPTNAMDTTVGSIMKNGLGSFGKSLTVGNLLGLWDAYKQNQILNKQMDALDQNMKIAKQSYNAKIKTMNNTKERGRVLGAALADRDYEGQYDNSDYKTV